MTSLLRLGAVGAVAAGFGVAVSCAATRPVELGTERSVIVATRFDRCEGGVRVHRISITGAGHVWPGETPGFLLSKLVGRSTRELDATRAVLDFFGV